MPSGGWKKSQTGQRNDGIYKINKSFLEGTT